MVDKFKFSRTTTIKFSFLCYLPLRLFFNSCSIASGSCSPFSLISRTSCCISTELRAVPHFSCSSNLCLQQGSRSTFTFCAPVLLKQLCRHRLTFGSMSPCKTFFFSHSVVQDNPATLLNAVVTPFLCVRNALLWTPGPMSSWKDR